MEEKIEKKKYRLEKEVIEEVVQWWHKYREERKVLRDRKPLERQIDKIIKKENLEIDEAGIDLMLRIHVRSVKYLKNIVEEKYRYNLEGKEVEEIPELHKKIAQNKIERKKKEIEEENRKKKEELKKKEEKILERDKKRPTLSLKTANNIVVGKNSNIDKNRKSG